MGKSRMNDLPKREGKVILVDKVFKRSSCLSIFCISCFFLVANSCTKEARDDPFKNENTRPFSEVLINENSYIVGYNGNSKSPNWVLQIIESRNLLEESKYSHTQLSQSTEIPQELQASLSDYHDSDYSSGLLVLPLKNDILSLTFSLTNTVPMHKKFKGEYWNKLQNQTLEMARKHNKIVVISGPLFLNERKEKDMKFVTYQVIGQNKIAVPSHFFKTIYYTLENVLKSKSFLIPNKEISIDVPIETFEISVVDLQKISGILMPGDVDSYFWLHPPPP